MFRRRKCVIRQFFVLVCMLYQHSWLLPSWNIWIGIILMQGALFRRLFHSFPIWYKTIVGAMNHGTCSNYAVFECIRLCTIFSHNFWLVSNASLKLWTLAQDFSFYKCSKGCSHIELFKSPVLIIQGKQDIIKPEAAEYARRVIPTSHIVMLGNCGHYGWLDAEKEYLTAVRSFLTFGLTKSKPWVDT